MVKGGLMLNSLIQVVKEAGEIIKEGFAVPKQITHKASKDLVTEYDLKVEAYLKEKLTLLYPAYEFVAEESYVKDEGNPDKIIIDPIDGTTNFVNGVVHVAISLAVYRQGQPLIGIVYNPVLNDLYHATKGEGAFLNGQKIAVSKEADLKRSLIATGFPYSSDKVPEDFEWVVSRFARMLPKVQDIRRLGSASLDLCLTAQGVFDGYYEMNLKPWDVAAGILILQEAGGRVSDEQGEFYDIFGGKIIVASNGANHQAIIDQLR